MTNSSTAVTVEREEWEEECIGCDRARAGADRFFCEVCLEEGGPLVLAEESPFFVSDEMLNVEVELALKTRGEHW